MYFPVMCGSGKPLVSLQLSFNFTLGVAYFPGDRLEALKVGDLRLFLPDYICL